MSDLNDLNQPNGASSYQTEVWQTVRGHVLRLWQGDYTGMSGLVAGVRRWVVSGSDVKLVQRNAAGTEETLFDSATKVDESFVNASVRQSAVVDLGSTSVINCANGVFFKRTISSSVGFSVTNVPAASGGVFGICLRLNITSAATITWPSSFKWPNSSAPVLASGSHHYVYAVTFDGGTTWDASTKPDYAGS